MKDRKFKKGDWVFADFRLMMIDEEPKEGRSISVFDGILSTSSEYVFPLTIHTNLMSMHANAWSEKIRSIKCVNLNPEIFYWIEVLWAEGCKAGEDEREKHYKTIDGYCKSVLDAIDKGKAIKAAGINVFR